MEAPLHKLCKTRHWNVVDCPLAYHEGRRLDSYPSLKAQPTQPSPVNLPSVAQVQAEKEAMFQALALPKAGLLTATETVTKPPDNVTPVTKPVTKPVGRPRRYETDAARQAAYRTRNAGATT